MRADQTRNVERGAGPRAKMSGGLCFRFFPPRTVGGVHTQALVQSLRSKGQLCMFQWGFCSVGRQALHQVGKESWAIQVVPKKEAPWGQSQHWISATHRQVCLGAAFGEVEPIMQLSNLCIPNVTHTIKISLVFFFFFLHAGFQTHCAFLKVYLLQDLGIQSVSRAARAAGTE